MDMSPKAIAYRARKAKEQRYRRKRIPEAVRAYQNARYAVDPGSKKAVETRRWLRPDRVKARADIKRYVKGVRAVTFCDICGAQPIEWHNEDHPDCPHERVSSLVAQGKSRARVDAEIAKCVPLCKKCHMTIDGRMANNKRRLAKCRSRS